MIKLSDIIKSGGGNAKINRFINRYVLSKKEKKDIINGIKEGGSSENNDEDSSHICYRFGLDIIKPFDFDENWNKTGFKVYDNEKYFGIDSEPIEIFFNGYENQNRIIHTLCMSIFQCTNSIYAIGAHPYTIPILIYDVTMLLDANVLGDMNADLRIDSIISSYFMIKKEYMHKVVIHTKSTDYHYENKNNKEFKDILHLCAQQLYKDDYIGTPELWQDFINKYFIKIDYKTYKEKQEMIYNSYLTYTNKA